MIELDKKAKRLLSIDILRGFDMLMIIFADRFFYFLNQASNNDLTNFLATQFDHPEWFGFHFYDIIMPLFLFVVGVVIPFSMDNRLALNTRKIELYPHLLRRFLILFILGWVVQGNLLSLDITKFHIYSNTLQAIAVGYLFSTIAYIHLSKYGRYFLFFVCLLTYAVLLDFGNIPLLGKSQLLPDKNLAIYIDQLIFGRFDDGQQYTWFLTGLSFTATTLSGLFAGELLRKSWPRKRIASYLLILGILGMCLGMVLDIYHPIVKKIWTSSFVLFTSGICFVLLALFYWIIDVKGYVKWTFPFKVIGVNAITAYVISHVLDFTEIAKQLIFGIEQYVGPYYNSISSLGGFGIIYLILWYMNKNGTFIKI